MLSSESRQTEQRRDLPPRRLGEGEGLLFVGVLLASWAIAIGIGWVIWQIVPL